MSRAREIAERLAAEAAPSDVPDGALPAGVTPLGQVGAPSPQVGDPPNWIDVVFDNDGRFLYITDCHGNPTTIGRWMERPGGDGQRLRLAYPALVPVERLGPAAKHSKGPDTEAIAKLRIEPKLGTLRARVLAEFVADWRQGGIGLAHHQIAERLGVQLYSAAPRCTELAHGGWIMDSERRIDTPQGNPAVVWALTARAVDHYTPRGTP